MHGPDYTEKIRKLNRKNAREVANGIPPDKRARLIERMDALGMTEHQKSAYFDLVEGNHAGALVARILHHTKSPMRQNVFETAFLEYAVSTLPDLEVSSLPNRGPSAIYPLNGKIVRARDAPAGVFLAKSFDFRVRGSLGEILIATKHTEDEGGSQDNQFRDLVTIAEQSIGMSGHTAILLIADGSFYDRAVSDNDHRSRVNFLRNMVSGERQVAAGNGADLSSLVQRFRTVLDKGHVQ